MNANEKPVGRPAEGEKSVLSPVEEALARQAAMRPPRGPAKQLPPVQRTPKVKIGRKSRRRIPK